MDFTTHSSPIASGSRPIISSDSSLSPPLNTDQLKPPSESSPSTNELTDSDNDIINDEDSDDDESNSASPADNRRVERALKEMRGSSSEEKAALVYGLLKGSRMDELVKLLAAVLRRKRAGMGQLLVAWVSSSTGLKKRRLDELRKALRAPELKKAIPEENHPAVVEKVRKEWGKLVQCSDYFGKDVSCLQPDQLDIGAVFSQLRDMAPTWNQLSKSMCAPRRLERSAWSDDNIPESVQRKFVFLTILGLGIHQSHTAVGYRTQLGVYLKQNGLHQRAIDVLSRLGVTTGREAIGAQMKRMEQAAKVSNAHIFPLASAYSCRIG